MIKTVKFKNGIKVKVVPPEDVDSVLTPADKEMDNRAKAAVEAAIHKAKVCHKPIGRYDFEKKQAYLEMPDGERIYV